MEDIVNYTLVHRCWCVCWSLASIVCVIVDTANEGLGSIHRNVATSWIVALGDCEE